MTGQLKQLNIAFSPVEDRLLLRMTTGDTGVPAEYRFWLTRRFVQLLWKALEKMLEADTAMDPRLAPASRAAVMQFRQEAALAHADFSTPYAGETALTPLGPKLLLVSGLRVTKGPEGNQTLSLQTSNGQMINLAMNSALIHALLKLLADGVKKAEWNLPFSVFSEETIQAGETPKSVN